MDKHILRPAWPPTTHVDIFVYRAPLVIPNAAQGEHQLVDNIAEDPEFPHNSIHHSRAAATL